MTRDEIFYNVQIALKKTFPKADISTVNTTTHLRHDLGADSMDSISLMMELEDLFGATLPTERASEIKNIGQIIDVIDTQLRQQSSSTLTHQ
ncbi:MAG: acyl carrier protein [Candidatus Thiodiazotropha sp.]|jgi:acyl carrier protein